MPRKPARMQSLPLGRVYQLLEPGPVVLVTTARKGRANVMAQSWHTLLDFEPPLVGSVISNRNYSFELLKASKECVIGIPSVALAAQVVGCGNTCGRTVDKFRKFNLTQVPASRVAAPLIAECFANLECKVVDARMAVRYNFFVLEVVKAWIDRSIENTKTMHHLGKGRFMVAGRTITLASRMK